MELRIQEREDIARDLEEWMYKNFLMSVEKLNIADESEIRYYMLKVAMRFLDGAAISQAASCARKDVQQS